MHPRKLKCGAAKLELALPKLKYGAPKLSLSLPKLECAVSKLKLDHDKLKCGHPKLGLEGFGGALGTFRPGSETFRRSLSRSGLRLEISIATLEAL